MTSTTTHADVSPRLDRALGTLSQGKNFIKVVQFTQMLDDVLGGDAELEVLAEGALVSHIDNEVMPLSAAIDVLLDLRNHVHSGGRN